VRVSSRPIAVSGIAHSLENAAALRVGYVYSTSGVIPVSDVLCLHGIAFCRTDILEYLVCRYTVRVGRQST
jgi:hypothetical protein